MMVDRAGTQGAAQTQLFRHYREEGILRFGALGLKELWVLGKSLTSPNHSFLIGEQGYKCLM